MQQHCIGVNGTFFNTHRMLGQYFSNAYFPQITPEEAVPLEADLLAAAARSSAAKESKIISVAKGSKKPSANEDETDSTLEETTLV
jgi:hypothetical protein